MLGHFYGIFCMILRTGSKFEDLFNLPVYWNSLKNNYNEFAVFCSWGCELRWSKTVKISYHNRLHYIAVLVKLQKDLGLVPSLQKWAKNELEMFSINCTNVWPNFILILPRILKKRKSEFLTCSNVCDGITDWGLDPGSRPFLIYQSTETVYNEFVVFCSWMCEFDDQKQ